ncbi:MAG TPA: DUF2634 domain-containing protein [Candidatus Enterenecus stercoripullorum]|nr:DUF2634 domain-containing protein [Candidatus Enterenecus stercoripullorum]
MSIFPMIQPPEVNQLSASALPLCQEVAWDYQRNVPIWRRGEPVIVTGKEAVKVWIWKALHTARYRYEIYSWTYGNEFESLVGQAYTPGLKEAEAPRYLREALIINPYITAVTGITVDFSGSRLDVSGRAETIYGEVEFHADL